MVNDPDMEEHDVAIAVFIRAHGIDKSDAVGRADRAIRRALREIATDAGAVLDEGRNGTGEPMPVLRLMEVGMAARNGYLWLAPTSMAARERGLPWHTDR